MGCFTLFVESTARDISQVLTLNKVHPQVCADVTRCLDYLVQKAYEDQQALQPGFQESSWQICHAITSDAVRKALEVSIPRAEVEAEEKKNAALRQTVFDLKEELRRFATRGDDLEEALKDLRNAHQYTLYSYYHEVLTLRQRINDLEKQQAKRSPLKQLNSPPSRRASVALDPREARVNAPQTIGAVRGGLTSNLLSQPAPLLGNKGGDLLSSEETSQSFSSPVESGTSSKQVVALKEALLKIQGDEASFVLRQLEGQGVTEGGKTDDARAFNGLPNILPETHSESCANVKIGAVKSKGALPPGIMGRANREGSTSFVESEAVYVSVVEPPNTGRKPGGGLSVSESLSRGKGHSGSSVADSKADSSIDALFDYQHYQQLLNGASGTWERRYIKLVEEKDEAVRRLQLKRINSRLRVKYANLTRDQAMRELQDSLDQERTRVTRLQWCLHLAMKPVKSELQQILSSVRDEITRLVESQREWMAKVQTALVQAQNRSEVLLDFVLTLVEDISTTTTFMKKDAAAKTRAQFYSNPRPAPPTVQRFFHRTRREETRVKAAVRLAGSVPEEEGAPDPSSLYTVDELPFWSSHPVIKAAENALAELITLMEKLRYRRALQFGAELPSASHSLGRGQPSLDGGTSHGSTRPNSCSATADSNAFSANHAWKVDLVEGSDGLSGEEILHSLTGLHLRHAANAARCRAAMRRLNNFRATHHTESGDHAMSAMDIAREKALSVMVDVLHRKVEQDATQIVGFQKLLRSHLQKHGVTQEQIDEEEAEVEKSAARESDEEAAKRRAEEERQRYLKLLRSPYLYDAPLQSAGERSVNAMADAVSYVTFMGERIPIGVPQGEGPAAWQGSVGPQRSPRGQGRSPFGAVLDYCHGVQLGMPLSERGGAPVYLLYHGSTDAFYVGDEAGKPVLTSLLGDAAESTGLPVSPAPGPRGGPYAVPMTQILFPAPAPLFQPPSTATATTDTVGAVHGENYTYYTDVARSSPPLRANESTEDVGPYSERRVGDPQLAPVYLVPLTLPSTADGEDVVGARPPQSDLYTTTTSSPIPLAVSYNQLLRRTDPVKKTATYAQLFPRTAQPRGHHPDEPPLLLIRSFQQWPPSSPPPQSSPRGGPVLSASTADGDVTVTGGKRATSITPTSPSLSQSEMVSPALPVFAPPTGAAADTTAQAAPLREGQGCSEAAATWPAAPSSVAVSSALEKAKLRRAARLEREAQAEKAERDRRKAEWQQRRETKEPTKQEAFLRLHLPRLTPMPSPQDAAKLQQQLRPPAISTVVPRRTAETVVETDREAT